MHGWHFPLEALVKHLLIKGLTNIAMIISFQVFGYFRNFTSRNFLSVCVI